MIRILPRKGVSGHAGRPQIDLAKSQVEDINAYGYQRFVLMTAFRRLNDASIPAGTQGLSQSAVKKLSADLYSLDGRISQARAAVMGGILSGLDADQKSQLTNLLGSGMASWPTVAEPSELNSLTHDEKVAVMSYAGDMVSWYSGSVAADVYFCPERQGTYFGSFYLKDAPAVGNPGYSIGTNISGDMGNAYLKVLTASQRSLITGLLTTQKPLLSGIVEARTRVATELRKYLTGGSADTAMVRTQMARYGELDGALVAAYATAFATVDRSLTSAQRTQLAALRKQTVGTFSPKAAFLYSEPIPFPTVRNTDFLFGSDVVTLATGTTSLPSQPGPGPSQSAGAGAPRPAPSQSAGAGAPGGSA